MAYLADYFGGKKWTEAYPSGPGGPTGPMGPTGPGAPQGPSGPGSTPPGMGPAQAPGGPAGSAQAGPGTGFVPLAAYFAPNREGAGKLAGGLMEQFPAGFREAPSNGLPTSGDPLMAGGPGYRVRDANSQAEAASAFDTMNPLDSFLAKQAGGQPLFDRLAQWAAPYTPPARQDPDYGSLDGKPTPAPPPKPTGSGRGGPDDVPGAVADPTAPAVPGREKNPRDTTYTPGRGRTGR